MTEIRQTIIKNIKAVCEAKKIKNVDIAEHMGVSPGSVSNWFKGSNFLDVDNLYILCQFLGVSLDQIFGIDSIVFNALNEDENNVISAFRSSNKTTKENIRRILGVVEPSKKELSL